MKLLKLDHWLSQDNCLPRRPAYQNVTSWIEISLQDTQGWWNWRILHSQLRCGSNGFAFVAFVRDNLQIIPLDRSEVVKAWHQVHFTFNRRHIRNHITKKASNVWEVLSEIGIWYRFSFRCWQTSAKITIKRIRSSSIQLLTKMISAISLHLKCTVGVKTEFAFNIK